MGEKILDLGRTAYEGIKQEPLLAGFLGLAFLAALYLTFRGAGPSGTFFRLMFSPLLLIWVGLVAGLAYWATKGQAFPIPSVRHPLVESMVLLLYIAWLNLSYAYAPEIEGFGWLPGYHEASWVRELSRRLAALVGGWVRADEQALRLLEFPVFTNGILWIALPLLLLGLFGYRPGELGVWSFRYGWLGLLIGALTFLPFLPGAIAARGAEVVSPVVLLANFMNAFKEEFLFRGLLQTRMEALMGSPVDGMVVSALIFGLIHIPSGGFRAYFTNPASALAYALVTGAGGLALGYLYLRTRSLVPGTLIHFLGNMLG